MFTHQPVIRWFASLEHSMARVQQYGSTTPIAHRRSLAFNFPMKKLPAFPPVPWVRAIVALITAGSTTLALASTSAPSTGAPHTSAYIESPQPTTTVTTYSAPTYSSSYYGGYYGGSHYYGGYYNWPYSGGSYSYTIQPRRYFFPPTPPALGESYIRNRTKSSSLVRSTIPLSLSEYVNEPFYSPLSPFLYEESLSKKRQKMIDDYYAAKTALVNELRAKIDSLRDVDPATRASQLAEFAREQTPKIIPVEQTAYAIRDELTHWRFFAESSDWNEGRDWRLGDDTRWESSLDEAKLMRGAAFYQDGLSPAQRRLLREYAMELDDSGRGPTSEIALDARGPYLYFSPETSRIRLPSNLSLELRAKISSYVQQKSALKKELRDVLYREDRRWLDSRRTAALRTLAEQQAPRIAQLEPLAEEIRQELAPLPNPARPRTAAEVLPPQLANRISTFMEAKATYQRTMGSRLADLKRQFPTSRVEFVKMNDAFGIQIVPSRKLKAEDKDRIDRAISAIAVFNEEQIKSYDALVQEKEGIRDELIQSAGNLAPLVTARIVDVILREYSSTLAALELWRQYRDYEVAVLQPGLSPEQRRILFDAALVKLDQQLPHYTY